MCLARQHPLNTAPPQALLGWCAWRGCLPCTLRRRQWAWAGLPSLHTAKAAVGMGGAAGGEKTYCAPSESRGEEEGKIHCTVGADGRGRGQSWRRNDGLWARCKKGRGKLCKNEARLSLGWGAWGSNTWGLPAEPRSRCGTKQRMRGRWLWRQGRGRAGGGRLVIGLSDRAQVAAELSKGHVVGCTTAQVLVRNLVAQKQRHTVPCGGAQARSKLR